MNTQTKIENDAVLTSLLAAHRQCHLANLATDVANQIRDRVCQLFDLTPDAFNSTDPNWGGNACYASDLASHIDATIDNAGNDGTRNENQIERPTLEQVRSEFKCRSESSPMFVSYIQSPSARVLSVGKVWITLTRNRRIKANQILQCWW